ncbi:uncharacterized protein PG986_007945 [Apiospora aurea]|uniref:Uncharacterized protein n=1 Tax=Apiospora aurea TaxID=335848 RepID=A0ABR1QEB6_9PEZI
MIHGQYLTEEVPGPVRLASPSISNGSSARHMRLQAHLGCQMWVTSPKWHCGRAGRRQSPEKKREEVVAAAALPPMRNRLARAKRADQGRLLDRWKAAADFRANSRGRESMSALSRPPVPFRNWVSGPHARTHSAILPVVVHVTPGNRSMQGTNKQNGKALAQIMPAVLLTAWPIPVEMVRPFLWKMILGGLRDGRSNPISAQLCAQYLQAISDAF